MPACNCCGEAEAEEVEVAQPDGVVIATGSLCESCLARLEAGAEVMRQQFQAMLDAGLSREAANALMIARMDGRMPQA